jgi:hypothetical protein
MSHDRLLRGRGSVDSRQGLAARDTRHQDHHHSTPEGAVAAIKNSPGSCSQPNPPGTLNDNPTARHHPEGRPRIQKWIDVPFPFEFTHRNPRQRFNGGPSRYACARTLQHANPIGIESVIGVDRILILSHSRIPLLQHTASSCGARACCRHRRPRPTPLAGCPQAVGPSRGLCQVANGPPPYMYNKNVHTNSVRITWQKNYNLNGPVKR